MSTSNSVRITAAHRAEPDLDKLAWAVVAHLLVLSKSEEAREAVEAKLAKERRRRRE